MSYNKKIWANGDLITKEGMNNIEYGIYDAHDKINAINNKVEENTTDTNTARQDISDIKLQIGTEELTTTSKKLKGAINELGSQIKDIGSQKATKNEVDVERKRIDNLATLATGSTTGDAELIDGRVGADGIIYNNIGSNIRTNTKRIMDAVLKKTNNLLDPTTLELGDIGSWSGSTINTNSAATDKIRTGVIEIIEGNSYQFVRNSTTLTMSVMALFDSSGNFIQTLSATNRIYTIPTGVDAKYIRGRFAGTDVSEYNGDDATKTLQFKLYSENMILDYEEYGFKSSVVEKDVFNNYANKTDKIIYFDDKYDKIGNKIKGIVSRQNLSIFTGGGYEHVEISCSEGERYLISGYNSNSWDYALYIFANDSNNIVSYFNGATATIIDNLTITVPAGATKLIVNNDKTKNALEAYKLVATDLQRKIIKVFNSENDNKNKITELEYENEQFKNRIFKLENNNPFAFKNFDKGYVTFVFDDGRYDWDKIASIFNEYNLKLCLAIPPSELNNNSNSLGLGAKTIKDIALEVVERGGEVLCHSMTPITEDNVNDMNVMTQQFKTNKQLLENAGFNVRGIIMAGGTGQLLGGTIREGGDIFQKWSSQYYDYSDRYGITPNYYNPRKALKDGSSAIISNIQSTLANKKWSVYYGHTIDGTETGLDETELRAILQYCVDNDVTVVTYSYIYDNFKSTNLENRLLAIESK